MWLPTIFSIRPCSVIFARYPRPWRDGSRIHVRPRRPAMASKFSQASGLNANGQYHTITALSRWSILHGKQLPPADSITSIHVYDFDNTCAFISVDRSSLRRAEANFLLSWQYFRPRFRTRNFGTHKHSANSVAPTSLSMAAGGTTLASWLPQVTGSIAKRSRPGTAGGMKRSSSSSA